MIQLKVEEFFKDQDKEKSRRRQDFSQFLNGKHYEKVTCLLLENRLFHDSESILFQSFLALNTTVLYVTIKQKYFRATIIDQLIHTIERHNTTLLDLYFDIEHHSEWMSQLDISKLLFRLGTVLLRNKEIRDRNKTLLLCLKTMKKHCPNKYILKYICQLASSKHCPSNLVIKKKKIHELIKEDRDPYCYEAKNFDYSLSLYYSKKVKRQHN